MKKIVFALIFSSCALPIFSSAEDFTAAYAKCAITKNDSQRLACFDKITAGMVKKYKETQNNNGYSDIGLIDLKTDIKTLIGKKVSVNGYIQIFSQMLMLKAESMDMSPVMAGYEKLPRDDRKRILQNCQSELCPVQIFGTIRHGTLGLELDAEQIVWK